jgi:hypothetical protein
MKIQLHFANTEELDHTTCSRCMSWRQISSRRRLYRTVATFFLKGNFRFDCCRLFLQRDFAEVFTGWQDPRINEELPLRDYISAEYNNEIAQKI